MGIEFLSRNKLKPSGHGWSVRILCVLLLIADPRARADVAASSKADTTGFDLSRPDIASFVNRVVRRDNLPRQWVVATMGAAIVRPELTAAMDRPAETQLAWWQYRARFITPERVEAGRRFLKEHKQQLELAATRYGVPAEYLVAILGIETNYGQTPGSYREIDTLMTLAFDYPARAAAFRGELRQFLLLARQMNDDPLELHGSYGGAMGAPQFMPSNYRRFAVRNYADRRVDLWTDWDAVFSAISQFLTERGWQRGAPVLLAVRLAQGANPQISDGLKLDYTLKRLMTKGVQVDTKLPASTHVTLIGAVSETGTEYRVGFKNFYVISRYNPRINYAMAVCDLAQEIREQPIDAPKSPPAEAPKNAASGSKEPS